MPREISDIRMYVVVSKKPPNDMITCQTVKLLDTEENTPEYALIYYSNRRAMDKEEILGCITHEQFLKSIKESNVGNEGIYISVGAKSCHVPPWMIGWVWRSELPQSKLHSWMASHFKITVDEAKTLCHEVYTKSMDRVTEWTIYKDGHPYDSFSAIFWLFADQVKRVWMEMRVKIGEVPENGGYLAGPEGKALPPQRILRKVSSKKAASLEEVPADPIQGAPT